MKPDLEYDKTMPADQTPAPRQTGRRRSHYFSGGFTPRPDEMRGQQTPPSEPQWDARDDYEIDDSYPQEKRSRAPMIVAIVAAVVIALAAAGFLGYLFFFYRDGSEDSKPTAPATTAAETTVAPTTQGMTENAVARLVKMPDVEGKTEAEAYKALNEAGVKFRIKREYSEDVKLNCVISQSPAAGKELTTRDEATISLSKGKENEIIESTTQPKKQKATDPTEGSDDTEETRAPSRGGSDGFLLPDSASRNLSKSDLASLNHEELNLALNEIFARHGRIFTDPSIKAYFNAQSWYHGTVSAEEFDINVLNEYELYNIDLISEYQAELGYR